MMAAQSPPKPVVGCSNCQSINDAGNTYCGRCGVQQTPEPIRPYRHGNKPTLDMIEGNWEEYYG